MCRLAVLLLAMGVAACAGPVPPGAPVPDDADCQVPLPTEPGGPAIADDRPTPAAADHAAPIIVGVRGAVDPAHAPVPRNDGERLVFSHLYDTLVRVTCRGDVAPALAEGWQEHDGGRSWTFTLRPDARDWNGEPVTASHVGSSWVAAQAAGAVGSRETAAPRIASVRIAEPRTVHADFSEPVSLAFFADPALAVRTAVPEAGWPVGTGDFRPASDESPGTGRARQVSLTSVDGDARLEFRTVSGDPRNALDAGIDLLVTMDPAVIDYAAVLPDYVPVPLAWDRSYVLAVGSAAPAGAAVRARPPDAALEALARHTVRIDARPAAGLATALGECEAAFDGDAPARGGRRAAAGPAVSSRRIVYPTHDAVARGLAERLVALAGEARGLEPAWIAEAVPALAGAGTSLSAAGLPPARFAESLRRGGEAAYVFPVARREGATGCDAAGDLVRLAPWLAPAGGTPGIASAVLPLVETRSTLVARRGTYGVAVDGSGIPVLRGVRR